MLQRPSSTVITAAKPPPPPPTTMKAFKLIPLVLAGFCGYLHTVINRRFDEMGDLIAHPGSGSVRLGVGSFQQDHLDMPRPFRTSVVDNGNLPGMQLPLQLQEFTNSHVVRGSPQNPLTMLDLNKLQGPSVDYSDPQKGLADFGWKPPTNEERILAESPEYQETLLQYTLNMLPNHRATTTSTASDSNSNKDGSGPDHENGQNSDGAATANAAADNTNAGAHKDSEDDSLNPKPYDYNQIDIMVPASGQDERLWLLADRLGVALSNFNKWYETERRPAILRQLKQEKDDEATRIAAADGEEDAAKKQLERRLEDNQNNGHLLEEDDEVSRKLDLTFRLLVTRYPLDAQKTEADFQAFHQTLSEKTTLPLDQIEIVRVGHDAPDVDEHPLKFNRAHARNMLHQNACHVDTCIVTALDVDMQVLPIFFHRALKNVKPFSRAYFPIVFSEFNPETVQMVQDFLFTKNSLSKKKKTQNGGALDNNNNNIIINNNNNNNGDESEEDPAEELLLPPFSKHRGLWRDFGYGMYALAGSDANRFRFNEQYQGWGHEDNDFYKLVHSNMIVHRQREHGLIHGWHPKDCTVGKDIITQQQWVDCLNSRDVMEGSALGMLLRQPLPARNKEDFPGDQIKSDDGATDGDGSKRRRSKHDDYSDSTETLSKYITKRKQKEGKSGENEGNDNKEENNDDNVDGSDKRDEKPSKEDQQQQENESDSNQQQGGEDQQDPEKDDQAENVENPPNEEEEEDGTSHLRSRKEDMVRTHKKTFKLGDDERRRNEQYR